MKELIEFDFEKFTEGLKRMNLEHGFKGVDDDLSDENAWTVKGYQDCLEDIIELCKECLE